MKEFEITIKNPTGLHTRPGSEFVKLAKTFASDISIKKGEKSANAKSLVKVLQIGISQNDVIMISANGEDEEKAIASIADYINNLSE